MKKSHYNLAFWGSPPHAAEIFSQLVKRGFIPRKVITTPDRPAGRGMNMRESAVKTWAKRKKIDVLQPENLDNDNFKTELKATEWDCFIVVAYGKILPAWIIDLPTKGTINVHYSLLPLHRGASPVSAQILAGDEIIGVTIMKIDEKLDHGPILSQSALPTPDPIPTKPELIDILTTEAAELLCQTLEDWLEDNISPQPQKHEHATYCSKISKAEGEINLDDDPVENFRKIQAYSGWPRAYFLIDTNDGSQRVIITKAHLEEGELVIDSVIPAGKGEMAYRDFQKSLST